MKKSFESYSSFVTSKKGRWITVAIWIAIIAVFSFVFPQADSQKNEQAEAFLNDVPSEQAAKIVEENFSTNSGIPALLTWYKSTGLEDEDLTSIQSYVNELQDEGYDDVTIPPFQQIPLPALKQQVSEDGTTFVLPVQFPDGMETKKINEKLTSMKEVASSSFSSDPFEASLEGNSLAVRVTGPAGISVDATELFSQGDLSLLIGTVIIVLVFLLVIYRSPILALIPLLCVGMAYLMISPVLGSMAKADWIDFDSQAIAIMTVLLFGAGTDYCLFLISRYRRNLREEKNPILALRKAFTFSWGAIAMSGLTVVGALLVLLVADYGSIHRFAIPFSVAILIMMVASISLVPAILSILGRVSFYPFIPRTPGMKAERAKKKGKTVKNERNQGRFGNAIGNLVTDKPWVVAIAGIVLLGILASFSTGMKFTYNTLDAFPEDMPSRQGFTLLSKHFNEGELAPVQVVFEADDEQTVLDVGETLQDEEYIANVKQAQQSEEDSSLYLMEVELSMNPYSNEAMDRIPDIREAVTTNLDSENVWIAGQTATQYDTRLTVKDDEQLVIPIILGLIALLLLVYLRSITATAYLIGTVVLSYFSALGLGWVILHYGFGVDAIQGFIPLYAFVFIVALGEDYNIFMISSIWKKARQMPLREAIKQGTVETGGVITSAGLILAGTFMVLTTLPIQILVHFGTITALGVLIDTFVVRPFLVPSITTILGKWAFWPSKLQPIKEKQVKQKQSE
ncbi:MMPL family transporter [Radiobacillus kanasensis]|uniref:MMPL family transporter n=1 Tax=Radiobacillus kanasensis TaxID=2844358 RepID=UPI001E3D5F5D|nr:MMPL family transporter [Radiobacillus kanasensis]UFT99222.1 MMPL family transporter [Radiobacillus kanasensis]